MEGETLKLKSSVWGKEDGSVSKLAGKHTRQSQRLGGGDRQIPGLVRLRLMSSRQLASSVLKLDRQCS